MTPPRLFHLADPGIWSHFAASPAATYVPPGFDTEGFVHLSFAAQLAGTLALHLARAERIVLVELDPATLAAELELEPSRGGQCFPHLYRPIRRADILGAWDLQRTDGDWNLPCLGNAAQDDRPPARQSP